MQYIILILILNFGFSQKHELSCDDLVEIIAKFEPQISRLSEENNGKIYFLKKNFYEEFENEFNIPFSSNKLYRHPIIRVFDKDQLFVYDASSYFKIEFINGGGGDIEMKFSKICLVKECDSLDSMFSIILKKNGDSIFKKL